MYLKWTLLILLFAFPLTNMAEDCIPVDIITSEAKQNYLKIPGNETKYKKCRAKEKNQNTCDEAIKSYDTAYENFTESCGTFSTGKGCKEIVKSCEQCPDNKNFENNNCVRVHQKSQCPQLAGKSLTEAKDLREKASDKIKDLESDISELQADILEEQGKQNDLVATLEEDKSELQTDLLKARQELDENLKTKQESLNSLQEQSIAQINKDISGSLKVKHTLINATNDVHRQLRLDKNKVFADCRFEATQTLADYRQRRRISIKKGRFKQNSIRDLLSKNRVSFAKKDNARFKHYYNTCLKNSREQIKEIEILHKQSLVRIKQTKKEYLQKLEASRSKASKQAAAAANQNNQLLNDYYKNLQQVMTDFNKQEQVKTKKFQRSQGQFSKKISHLQKQFQQKTGELEATKKDFSYNKELTTYLKDKGTNESDDSFGSVLARADIADTKLSNLIADCACLQENKLNDNALNKKRCEKLIKKKAYIRQKNRKSRGQK